MDVETEMKEKAQEKGLTYVGGGFAIDFAENGGIGNYYDYDYTNGEWYTIWSALGQAKADAQAEIYFKEQEKNKNSGRKR